MAVVELLLRLPGWQDGIERVVADLMVTGGVSLLGAVAVAVAARLLSLVVASFRVPAK